MKHGLRPLIAILAVVALGLILWFAWRPRGEDRDLLTGYVEGDQLYLSSPVAGSVGQVSVAKGQRVVADKGYGSDALRTQIRERGVRPVIP